MTVLDGYTCIDCDDDPAVNKCLRCNHNGIRAHCLECGPGYRLVDGQCAECANVGENCASCTANVCQECNAGFYLDSNNECQSCKDTLHHCLECSGPDTCDVCDLQIASLGSGG